MEIYSPSDDSLFLASFVKNKLKSLKPKSILDMGSGSGIQAMTCILSGALPASITLVDINPDAISHLQKYFPDSKVIHSDLFSKLKTSDKFDLIIFNPPYLPEDKFDSEADTAGGKRGDEIIVRFLKKLKSHLTDNGKALLLLSSLTPMNNINKEFKRYKAHLLGKKKLFFEELYVWELKT
jgi:HemK-related putative methylase